MRATKALFISMLLVGLVAGTAKAAPADVQHFTFRGSFAEALWFTSTDTSATDTYISPSKIPCSNQPLGRWIEAFCDSSHALPRRRVQQADCRPRPASPPNVLG